MASDEGTALYVADGAHVLTPAEEYAFTLVLSLLSALGSGYIVVAFLHAQKWSDPRAARLVFFLGVFNLIWACAYFGTAVSALARAPLLNCAAFEMTSAVSVNLSMVWSCVIAFDLLLRVWRGEGASFQRWRLNRARAVERGYLFGSMLLAGMLTWPNFVLDSEHASSDRWRCQLMFGDGVRSNRNLAKLAGPLLAFAFNLVAWVLVAHDSQGRQVRCANVVVRERWRQRMSRFLLVFVITWAARVANLLANVLHAPLVCTRALTLAEILTFPLGGFLNAIVYGNHPWLRRSCKTCLVFYGCFDKRCPCLRSTDATFASVGNEKDVRFSFNDGSSSAGSGIPPPGLGWSDAFDADAPRREARDFLLCSEDKLALFALRPDLDREGWLAERDLQEVENEEDFSCDEFGDSSSGGESSAPELIGLGACASADIDCDDD